MESEINKQIRELLEKFGVNPAVRMEKYKRGFVSLTLLGAIRTLFDENKKTYENKAGEACIALEKILSGRQATNITDDECKFASMNVEAKRKQDEINYIQSLRNQVKELKYELELARKGEKIYSY
jgi:hypothetical protein